MKRKFCIGDKVMICPEYWEKLSRSRTAAQEYLENGGGFIYTVISAEFDEDGYCCNVELKEGPGLWSQPAKYLIHIAENIEDPDFDLGDLL